MQFQRLTKILHSIKGRISRIIKSIFNSCLFSSKSVTKQRKLFLIQFQPHSPHLPAARILIYSQKLPRIIEQQCQRVTIAKKLFILWRSVVFFAVKFEIPSQKLYNLVEFIFCVYFQFVYFF